MRSEEIEPPIPSSAVIPAPRNRHSRERRPLQNLRVSAESPFPLDGLIGVCTGFPADYP